MQYAVFLYADADLDAGPGAPEWEATLGHHTAFNRAVRERGFAIVSGAPLHAKGTATSVRRREGAPLVTDGPFAETKEQLWGFYVVEAADLDAVIDLAGLLWEAEHGTVEIRPVVDVPAPV